VAKLWFIAAAMLGSALEDPNQITLSAIGAARKLVYCDTCQAGRLKVFAKFQLQIEQTNPALGSDYFPISDLTGKLTNLRMWREETFRSGLRFKQRVVSPLPERYRGPVPGTYDLTVCYDGVHSWRYRPGDLMSEKFKGITGATQIIQDYYGDMIGSKIPGGSATMSRTVPAPSDAAYDLDHVVASSLYRVVGTETVHGEPCTIIERPGMDRIWLANGRNYPVVKREWRWTVGGPLKRRIINTEFRDLGGGAWLPFAGRMEIFSHPSTPPERRVGVLTAVVEVADTNVPDSEFQPEFLRGTFVIDAETNTRSVAGYTEAEFAAEEARGFLKKVKARKSADALAFIAQPWWQRNWLILLGASVISAIAILTKLRSRSQGGK